MPIARLRSRVTVCLFSSLALASKKVSRSESSVPLPVSRPASPPSESRELRALRGADYQPGHRQMQSVCYDAAGRSMREMVEKWDQYDRDHPPAAGVHASPPASKKRRLPKRARSPPGATPIPVPTSAAAAATTPFSPLSESVVATLPCVNCGYRDPHGHVKCEAKDCLSFSLCRGCAPQWSAQVFQHGVQHPTHRPYISFLECVATSDSNYRSFLSHGN
jgi:hypothetical protein